MPARCASPHHHAIRAGGRQRAEAGQASRASSSHGCQITRPGRTRRHRATSARPTVRATLRRSELDTSGDSTILHQALLGSARTCWRKPANASRQTTSGQQIQRSGCLQRAGQQAGMAIEAGAEGRDQQRGQDQDAGDPQALALRRGEGRAGDQQQNGGAPGQVHPVRQADRQHDKAGADQRRDELAGLGREVGIIGVQPGKVGPRRHHAHPKQHDAAQRHRAGGGGDGEIRLVPAGQCLRAGTTTGDATALRRAAASHCRRTECRPGTAGSRSSRAGTPRARRGSPARDIAVQPEQHGGVEHADAAGQAGGEARGVGSDVDAQEDRESGRCRAIGRQQW